MPTPVDKGKKGVAEESPVKESGSGKKKKRNKGSLFRKSSRKKILGASPSSAERWVGLGYMEAAVLLDWLKQKVKGYGIKVTDLTSSLSDGMALCALIHHYQPDLMYVCVCIFVFVMGWPCVPSYTTTSQTSCTYVCACLYVHVFLMGWPCVPSYTTTSQTSCTYVYAYMFVCGCRGEIRKLWVNWGYGGC